MKLLIAGSRGITEYDLTPHIPADTDLIISGGAIGVDALAEQYADSKRISKLILRPRYDLYSRFSVGVISIRQARKMPSINSYLSIICHIPVSLKSFNRSFNSVRSARLLIWSMLPRQKSSMEQ